jgi:hypothetical protein
MKSVLSWYGELAHVGVMAHVRMFGDLHSGPRSP